MAQDSCILLKVLVMLEHMEQVLERKMSLEVLEHMMGLEQVLEHKELVPERMEQVLEYMMAM